MILIIAAYLASVLLSFLSGYLAGRRDEVVETMHRIWPLQAEKNHPIICRWNKILRRLGF